MTSPSFTGMATAYAKMWADLVPTPSHLPALRAICRRLISDKPTYQLVSQSVWHTADYWYIVALLDQMEGGGGCNTYLGNGQPLHRRTTEVPAGRGPFSSFEAGCLDALHLDGFDKVTAWPIERIGYQFEAWNGWGYLHKPVIDPYLASFSNLYTKGKYTRDDHYDPEAVSDQPGALTILKVLVDMDPTIKITSLTPSPSPSPSTAQKETANMPTAAELAANPSLATPVAAPPVQIDLASMLAHLQLFLPMVTMVISAIPETAPYAPLVNVASKALTAASDVTTTMQTNPAALPETLAEHLGDIGPMLQQIATVFPQWPTLGTVAKALTSAGAALAPPAPPVAAAA